MTWSTRTCAPSSPRTARSTWWRSTCPWPRAATIPTCTRRPRSRRGGSRASASNVPFGSATDAEGTTTTIWRCADEAAIATVRDLLSDRELLIADGHHRYETARVYADEVGGEGEHRYTLMFLCSMSDPGLTVLPTHRLLTGVDDGRRDALRAALEASFDTTPVERDALAPSDANDPKVSFGYLDAFERRPVRLTLRDPG